ncbi:MAG: tetratricopeptide repeat protein [Anaerolineaceae bacterium]|nr:tetratricopeptide repeat protein [Anaerolineaceae bacterium]
MNRKLFLLTIIFVLGSSLTGCKSANNPNDSDESELSNQTSSTLILPNFLVEIEGQAEIRRAGWNKYLPANFGTTLNPGDLIRIAEGGQATVFCGDENSWEQGSKELVGDGQEHGVPCESGRPPRPWPDVVALRGKNDFLRPYIEQPRNTALLNDKPNLILNLPDKSENNPVIISILSDDGKERPSFESSDTILSWPEEWDPLEIGGSYVIVIGDGPIDTGATTGQVFWLLDTQNEGFLNNQELKLRQTGLSDTAQNLLVAELYQEYDLFSEAIELLKPLTISKSSPIVWLYMGRIYMETGLPEQAYSSYQEALSLAEKMGDLQSLAETHIGLALVSQMNNDLSSHTAHIEEARRICEEIGDIKILQEIEKLSQ